MSDISNFDWELSVEVENLENSIEKEACNVDIKSPVYSADFTGYLTEKEFCIETGKHVKNDEPAFSYESCFNCQGKHSLNDCTEKWNRQKISENRRKLMSSKKSRVQQYARYHVHTEDEQKLSHLQPGKISQKLTDALHLRDGEVPEYIYRMRVLGYPPGWLQDAEVIRSKVALINGEGNSVEHPEEEEGETEIDETKYQPEKLILYEGFNVPFKNPPQSLPRWARHAREVPEMQERHSRESFLKFMTLNKAVKYKRKKLKGDTSAALRDSNLAQRDMEVDDLENVNSVLELPIPNDVILPPTPPGDSTNSEEPEDGEISDENSDEGKLKLEKTENTTSATGNETMEPSAQSCQSQESVLRTPNNLKSSLDSEVSTSCETAPLSDSEKRMSSLLKKKLADESSNSSNESCTVKHHKKSSSVVVSLGTFTPESISPYSTLPDSAKWSVDVSDHILHENLPNSLGTWNTMKGIVKSVKSFMEQFLAEGEGED